MGHLKLSWVKSSLLKSGVPNLKPEILIVVNESYNTMIPDLLRSAYTNEMHKKAIFSALRNALPCFSGTLLDVGCGDMPYKSLILERPSRVEKYIGLDMQGNKYNEPDLKWDGRTIPLSNHSVECVILTEVLEHCAEPEFVLREVHRVMRPAGSLFHTVPFLWPLHDVPNDEYCYTPFALERHLKNSGFNQIRLKALGGWDASLAQMIALWVSRRPMSPRKRKIFSLFSFLIVNYLSRRDRPPIKFNESCMITGLSGTAIKPY